MPNHSLSVSFSADVTLCRVQLEEKQEQAWPSGPRCYVQVVVCSHAWVRVPPLAFFLLLEYSYFSAVRSSMNEIMLLELKERLSRVEWCWNTIHGNHLLSLTCIAFLCFWIPYVTGFLDSGFSLVYLQSLFVWKQGNCLFPWNRKRIFFWMWLLSHSYITCSLSSLILMLFCDLYPVFIFLSTWFSIYR